LGSPARRRLGQHRRDARRRNSFLRPVNFPARTRESLVIIRRLFQLSSFPLPDLPAASAKNLKELTTNASSPLACTGVWMSSKRSTSPPRPPPFMEVRRRPSPKPRAEPNLFPYFFPEQREVPPLWDFSLPDHLVLVFG
jgi:hypothetical protein